jgi:hypothetical protein
MPKTATTSIQDSLYLNAEYLESYHGIDYCKEICSIGKVSCSGHHPLAWNLFVMDHPHRSEINHDEVKKRLKNMRQVLFSSEWFSRASEVGVNRLVKEWSLPKERWVVIVVRNELDFVKSTWMQSVKMGYTLKSFQSYIQDVYLPSRISITSKMEPWLSTGFRPIFIRYEELAKNVSDISISFLEKVYGISVDGRKWKSLPKSINVSPSLSVLERYRRIANEYERLFSISKILKGAQKPKGFNAIHNFVCDELTDSEYLNIEDLVDSETIKSLKLIQIENEEEILSYKDIAEIYGY